MNHETHEKHEIEASKGELIVYPSDDGQIRLDVRLENETIWLTINQMAQLFGVNKSGISRHLKNIFETGELQREATVAKFATVQNEGGSRCFEELLAPATSVRLKRFSGGKSLTSMPPALTTIRTPKAQKCFSGRCRTRCTGPPTATLPPS